MLYQCPCHTLEIPTSFFWYLTMRELEAMCMDKNIIKWKDPFTDSLIEAEGERSYKKNMKTSLDDIDYEDDEDEDTWIDTDYSVSIEWEE